MRKRKRREPEPFTTDHAERLAAILEDNGWNIFDEGELYCGACGDPFAGTNLHYSFCPECGVNLKETPPELDEGTKQSTLRFLAHCVNEAMEEA